MRQVVLALFGVLGLIPVTSLGFGSAISITQVTLSCTDGHSVIASVDQTALTNLIADVQAINSSGSGLSCTLDTPAIDPSAETAEWTVYDYNSSGHAIAPRNSPNSMPATQTGGTVSFPFIAGTYTALLTTTDRALTGDISGKTLTDTVTWSGTGTFSDQHNGGCLPDRKSVRFYFRSPSASGPSGGTPPAGFYTQFWWSNPDSVTLEGDFGSGTLSATLTAPVALTQWSDWNGQEANASPAVTEGFIEATQHVQAIGLSFGGGCFFENGVTTSTGGTFSSTFGET